MKRRDAVLMLSCSTLGPLALAQVRDLNDAINKAGRQRMLSQRMAKAYCALGQNVRRELADKVLGDSMALFDRQLVELKAFAPKSEIRTTYDRLEAAWSSYKATLVGASATKPGADAVLGAANEVLALAHQGTVQLEGLSDKPAGRLVNIAGRQRMLSQRMAAMYLCASWGVQPDAALKALASARAEFVKAHDELKASRQNTPSIAAELELAEQQFGFFDAALRTLKPGSASQTAQSDVLTTSERILQVMDGVTGQYARQPG